MRKLSFGLFACILLLVGRAEAGGLFFWDKNGTAPGCGESAPTGTWGTDAYWNTNAAGMGTGTRGWENGGSAVFTAGNDGNGTYTVQTTSNLWVADIHVDYGQVTFAGGPIRLATWDESATAPLLSVGHKDANTVVRFEAPLTGNNGIIRYKRGTMIFAATNTYAGPTVIEGGVLQLGASQVIPVTSPLVLANNNARGDVFFATDTPATFAADGFSQNFGPLRLSGPHAYVSRTLDFGHGASTLAFADSSAEAWLSTENEPIPLFIVNYTPDQDHLRFGTTAAGLTPAQLAQLRFADFQNLTGVMDEHGFVVPALPRLTGAQRLSETTLEIHWVAEPGRNYRVQYKDDLNEPLWNDYFPDIVADSTTGTLTDPTATGSARYYRVTIP